MIYSLVFILRSNALWNGEKGKVLLQSRHNNDFRAKCVHAEAGKGSQGHRPSLRAVATLSSTPFSTIFSALFIAKVYLKQTKYLQKTHLHWN